MRRTRAIASLAMPRTLSCVGSGVNGTRAYPAAGSKQVRDSAVSMPGGLHVPRYPKDRGRQDKSAGGLQPGSSLRVFPQKPCPLCFHPWTIYNAVMGIHEENRAMTADNFDKTLAG